MALDFAAGCLGGCAGVMVGHPLDTVKVKLQTQDFRNPVYRGTWHCFTTILKKESVSGIYKGVSSPMAGVAVVNAIVFGVYGNSQRYMSDPESLRSYFLAGAAAGTIQSVVASPVELVKTRLQTNSRLKSPIECIKNIQKQDGVKGIFKGLGITGLREFFGYGLYFATYEALTKRSPNQEPVGTPHMLLAGGLSGTVSWTATYPCDVIKTRLQADVSNEYKGAMDCLMKSIQKEGWRCLLRGLTPTIIRAFPTNAVTFTVVTWVFRLAGVGESSPQVFSDTINTVLENIPQKQSPFNRLYLVDGSCVKDVQEWSGFVLDSSLDRSYLYSKRDEATLKLEEVIDEGDWRLEENEFLRDTFGNNITTSEMNSLQKNIVTGLHSLKPPCNDTFEKDVPTEENVPNLEEFEITNEISALPR